ncbi:type II secretion system protein [Terribacillus sp. 179-K 1B1 HS]|uniref:PulJ/GspJ family protein n=1 Tax=Terribacillus sp. 179-K 1B1 HS TaxID=3142388 RepID=UPI0039A148A8
MKDIVHKQRGFTLLEILVGLTILAFVITAFIPIFTQAAIHNRVNGDTLKTNEAAQVVASQFHSLTDVQRKIGKSAPLQSCSNQQLADAIEFPEEEVIGDISYKVRVSLCAFDQGDVENLIQAVFTIENAAEKPVTEGTARKFLSSEEVSDVQAP